MGAEPVDKEMAEDGDRMDKNDVRVGIQRVGALWLYTTRCRRMARHGAIDLTIRLNMNAVY